MHVRNTAIVDDQPVAPLNRPIALKKRSLVLMIVLSMISLGFYYPIWFLRRRNALNSLDSPRKLDAWPFLLFLAYWIALFAVSIAAGGRPLELAFGQGVATPFTVVRLGVGIVMVVQCFYIKDILEEHLAGPEDTLTTGLLSERVQLSPILTFLFQIFYLQYVINRSLRAQPAGV